VYIISILKKNNNIETVMKKIIFYFDPTVKKLFVEKQDENGKKKLGLSSTVNFVSPAEIVARIVDLKNEEDLPHLIDSGYSYYKVAKYIPLKMGNGIYYDDINKCYKASDFAFIVFDSGFMKLLPLLTVSRDKLTAFFHIYPTKFGKIPSSKEIEGYLHEFKIISTIGEKHIAEQLAKVNPEKPKILRLIVAKGQTPIKGNEEYFLPLISLEKHAGVLKANGSMDYKEVGAIIQVKKGDKLLKRIPAVKAVEGYTVFGDKITYEDIEKKIEKADGTKEESEDSQYRRGENIVQDGSDDTIFVSAIDGVLNVAKRKISVLKTVEIHGDVNYDTGNINFNGSVHITGSVLAGFIVKATGSVIIDNIVEDAVVEAGEDIVIQMGVVGKESVKLIAGGKITSKYFLNAKVEAGGEITVEDSIINSEVFSNKKISVIAKNGKIIGGMATALYEIEVNVAGAVNETGTSLNVGRNLFIEKELKRLREKILTWKEEVAETIRKLKVSFGEGVFEDPKKYIAILPPVKKKNCLLLLQELSNGNKKLKELSLQGKEVEAKLKLDKEPYIVIHNKIYPGTTLNIKKSVRKIDEVIDNAKFFEDMETKTIRYTAAD